MRRNELGRSAWGFKTISSRTDCRLTLLVALMIEIPPTWGQPIRFNVPNAKPVSSWGIKACSECGGIPVSIFQKTILSQFPRRRDCNCKTHRVAWSATWCHLNRSNSLFCSQNARRDLIPKSLQLSIRDLGSAEESFFSLFLCLTNRQNRLWIVVARRRLVNVSGSSWALVFFKLCNFLHVKT